MSEHEHHYEHLDTSKWHDSSGGYQIQWVRIERFFCTRCLDIREVRKEEWSREKPEWYK